MPGPRDDQFDNDAIAPATSSGSGGEKTTPFGSSPANDDTEKTTPYATTPLSRAESATPSLSDAERLRPLATRYDLLNELGRGGMGVVYRARDRETGDVVALKVLLPEIAADQEVIGRFKSELLLARKVTHKNVCRVHDLLRFGDLAVISMEYIEGESLRAVLRRKQGVSLRKGLDWARQMCAALGEAHTQGVVHRDLKPENMLIARDGTVKVMDFGIARSLDASATHKTGGTIIGTPAYMSPEQAQGKPADHRSDVYSLGLILYEIFTGRPAFTAENATALLNKHIHETPPSVRALDPTLHPALEKAVQKCLAKDPAKRYLTASELDDALSSRPQAEPGESANLADESTLPLFLRQWQRSDWFWLGGALAAAVFFFLSFKFIFPYSLLRLSLSEEEAISAAQRILARYVPDADRLSYSAELSWSEKTMDATVLSTVHGLDKGRSILMYESYWRGGWTVFARRVRGPDRKTLIVGFDAEGKLRHLNIGPNPDKESRSVEQEAPGAVALAESLFGVRVAGIAPEKYTKIAGSWRDSRGNAYGGTKNTPVEWRLPTDRPEVRQSILIWVSDGKLASAGRRFMRDMNPEEWNHRWNRGSVMMLLLPLLILFLLILFSIFLFVARRLYQQEIPLRNSVCFVASAASTGLIMFAHQPEEKLPFWWLWGLAASAVFCCCLLVALFVLSVPLYYLRQAFPNHLRTLAALLSNPLRARSSGLATLRGITMGFVFVGAYSALQWVAQKLAWGGPGLDLALFLPDRVIHPVLPVGLSWVSATVGVLFLLAFPLAIARRATHRFTTLLIVITLLWGASAAHLPGASGFPVWLLFAISAANGLFLGYVFLRYELLTCMITVVTIETWLVTYPLSQLFGPLQPWGYGLAIAHWFLIVLGGLAIYFSEQIGGAAQRVRALFS